MKYLLLSFLIVSAAPTLLAQTPAKAAHKGFDFDYRVLGPSAALPSVVYNDGTRTYLEMPAGVQPTGAFVDVSGGRRFLPVQSQSPYYVVGAIAPTLDVVTSAGQIEVVYQGVIAEPALAASEAKQATDKERMDSALKTLNTIVDSPNGQQMLSEAQAPSPVSNAAPLRAGVTTPATVQTGAQADPASISAETPATAVPQESWTLAPGSLYEQLRTWCDRAHYTLVWNTGKRDWTIQTTTTLTGTFTHVITTVMNTLAKEGVPITGGVYNGNQTVVVETSTQSRSS